MDNKSSSDVNLTAYLELDDYFGRKGCSHIIIGKVCNLLQSGIITCRKVRRICSLHSITTILLDSVYSIDT